MTDQAYSIIGNLEIDADTSIALTIPELDLLVQDLEIKDAIEAAKTLLLEAIQDSVQERFAQDPRLYSKTIEAIKASRQSEALDRTVLYQTDTLYGDIKITITGSSDTSYEDCRNAISHFANAVLSYRCSTEAVVVESEDEKAAGGMPDMGGMGGMGGMPGMM
ncbi:MAG: hypothetical protein AAF988_08845 [Pseudomonadota bacterium]